MSRYKLLKKQNYFHAVFDKKGVEVIDRDGTEVVKISGYASTIDKDRVGDVVLPGAFVETLSTYKENPVILLQHKMDKPIWKAVDLAIDDKGLKIEAEITEDIDGAMSAIKNGVLKGFSIGYRVKDWEEKGNDDGIYYEIKEVELLEISVVSVPANPFTLIKSLEDSFKLEEAKGIEQDEEKEDQIADEEAAKWAEEEESIDEVEEVQDEETSEEEVKEDEEVDNKESEEETETWSEGSEKGDEIAPESDEAWESQEEEKGLQDMSMKMMLKRLDDESKEIQAWLEKDLSETLEKALWDKAESIKSTLLDEVNSKFTEYTKGQAELLTVMVDSMKSFDNELTEMLELVKTLRNSKGYNYEKPVKAEAKKQDKLSKALEAAKNIN